MAHINDEVLQGLILSIARGAKEEDTQAVALPLAPFVGGRLFGFERWANWF